MCQTQGIGHNVQAGHGLAVRDFFGYQFQVRIFGCQLLFKTFISCLSEPTPGKKLIQGHLAFGCRDIFNDSGDGGSASKAIRPRRFKDELPILIYCGGIFAWICE